MVCFDSLLSSRGKQQQLSIVRLFFYFIVWTIKRDSELLNDRQQTVTVRDREIGRDIEINIGNIYGDIRE